MAINGRRAGKIRSGKFASGKATARHPKATTADPYASVEWVVTDASTGERIDLPSSGVKDLHGFTGLSANRVLSGEDVLRSEGVTVNGRKVTVFAVKDGAAKELPADVLWGWAGEYARSKTPPEKSDSPSPAAADSSRVMEFLGSMPVGADASEGDPIDESERAEAARVRILLDKKLGMKTEPWIFKLARKH